MIRELAREHELILTCRPLANTIEMLELFEFKYHIIGEHYGRDKIKKAFGFLIRVSQLYDFLRTRKIDVAISHSSFYSPIVSRLLGIRCIYLNDNEHADGNRVSFIFADQILIPEFMHMEKVVEQWANRRKVTKYPGVKEGIYLWCYHPGTSTDFAIEGKGEKKVVFIRPEPWTAQYYNGKCNFIDELLMELQSRFTVILLPRGSAQEAYYRQERFAGIIVPKKSMTLSSIMENCDLFIGAGGTMTREAAVLGIPTISIYQDQLLDVDKFLIEKGFMFHEARLDIATVVDIMDKIEKRPPNRDLLHKGQSAYALIKDSILLSYNAN